MANYDHLARAHRLRGFADAIERDDGLTKVIAAALRGETAILPEDALAIGEALRGYEPLIAAVLRMEADAAGKAN